MKILQINKFHYIRGGSDKVYFQTSDLLTKNGHEVIHFSTHSIENRQSPTSDYFVQEQNFLSTSTLNKVLSSGKYIYSIEAREKLDTLLKDHKPDCAHLHIFFGELSLSILPILKKHNIPVVMTLHEYKMLCPVYTLFDLKSDICERCARGNYTYCVIKKCNKNDLSFSILASLESFVRDKVFPYEKYIDHFIVVSNFSRLKHLEYKEKLKDKISVIYNFFDKKQFDKVNKGSFLLYFGRLSREKGLITLLSAMMNLNHFKLKIVGTGPMEEKLNLFCKENGLSNVDFLGFKSGDELDDIINSAAFSIVPSEWYETFGLTILESMQAGTPVISSGLGGMKELVNESTGFLFEPGNVSDLERVIIHAMNLEDDQYHKMANNGVLYASTNFNSDIHYEKLMEVYKSVIDHNA